MEEDENNETYVSQGGEEEPGGDQQSYIKCKFCEKVMQKGSYHSHKMIHKDGENYFCRLCDMRYKQSDHLKKHILKYHRRHTTSKLSLCCDEEDPLKRVCAICSKRFASDGNLQSHMSLHFPQGIKQHIPPDSSSVYLCLGKDKNDPNQENYIMMR